MIPDRVGHCYRVASVNSLRLALLGSVWQTLKNRGLNQKKKKKAEGFQIEFRGMKRSGLIVCSLSSSRIGLLEVY